MYDNRLQNLPPEITLLVSQVDELKGRWSASNQPSRQILRSLRRSTLITSTGASTRMEGAQMNDQQIERYLDGLKIQRFSERDSQEVRGYYETLELIFDNYSEIDLTENSIKHLHSQLLQYCTKDARHRGNYKHMDNWVEMTDAAGTVLATVFETTPAYLTPKEMQELVAWRATAANNSYHPLLVIANFIVSFLKIHPFLDGNGRLSRLLTNCLLLRHGYEHVTLVSHESLIEKTKTDYYKALRQSQLTFKTKAESIVDWTTYFLNILLTQALQAIDLLQDIDLEQDLSPKQIAVWRYLGAVVEATPGQIAEATKVNRATVSQALAKLAGLNYINRLGQGRTTRYKKLRRDAK